MSLLFFMMHYCTRFACLITLSKSEKLEISGSDNFKPMHGIKQVGSELRNNSMHVRFTSQEILSWETR